jgi:CheY-like chemotaxis protein
MMGQIPRVLLVDDQKAIRTALQRILTKAGFEVVPVASGEEAVRVIEQEKRFDAILTDLEMPTMHGTKLIPLLRSLAPNIAIIVLTGHRDSQCTADLFEDGVKACLDKPVGGDVLVATVRSAIADQPTD